MIMLSLILEYLFKMNILLISQTLKLFNYMKIGNLLKKYLDI